MEQKNTNIFDDQLIDFFNKDGFYAKPKKTKIYLSTSNGEEVISNSVVMNMEESNEKIPVYSYNTDVYKKYLNGKKLITGVIALRKITIASFLSLIKKTNKELELEVKTQELQNKIDELLKVSGSDELYRELRIEHRKELIDVKKQYEETKDMDVFEISDFDKILKGEDLLYYRDKYTSDEKFEIKLQFEGDMDNQELTIEDVLFVKKSTEINIGKNDIIEVYQFIGNPKDPDK